MYKKINNELNLFEVRRAISIYFKIINNITLRKTTYFLYMMNSLVDVCAYLYSFDSRSTCNSIY